MGEQLFRTIKIIWKSILTVLYPSKNKCLVCGYEDVDGLCYKCLKSITFCDKDELCVGYYKGALKELILLLKYKKDFQAGEILVNFLQEKIKKYKDEYYLTYIPIDKKRLKERGFNQCEYIAKELSITTGIKTINTLKKIKETKIQKTLKREERMENLKNAFEIIDEKDIKGKKFILLDDVITTGATLNEGIKVLKKYGAVEIKILTLAKSYI